LRTALAAHAGRINGFEHEVEKLKPDNQLSQMRRRLLLSAVPAGLVGLSFGKFSAAQALAHVTLSVPGPRGAVSYPLELAVRLGFDKAEGIALRLKFVSGGGGAIQDIQTGNAGFAVFGFPAAMLTNTKDATGLVALAAVDDLPLYTLVVRQDLRSRVKRIEDLKGLRIGIFSSTLATKTTSHQLAEVVLKGRGIAPSEVSLIAAGQSWDTQSSAFLSRAIDASMCDEPFATRLTAEKLAFPLFATGNPADAKQIPGAGFLRAALYAPRTRVEADPQLAERMVRIVTKTLAWMASQPSERVADALEMADSERSAYLTVAKMYPRQYSTDGKFSTAQLRETEIFFRASNSENPDAQRYPINSMVMTRWSGSKP
jgi:NitT/TauT family transport system substrate-binding protein